MYQQGYYPQQPVKQAVRKPAKEKRSVLLMIACIIGVVMLAASWGYVSSLLGKASSADSAEAIGTGIAAAMAMPHMIIATLACIFAVVGYALRVRWGVLVAAILYSVALVLMLPWFYFVIIQMVLCYISYGKTRSTK